MTYDEAVSALLPLVGAGGVTSIVVAFLGYKAAAAKGRPDVDGEAPALAIGCALADKGQVQALTTAISDHTLLMARLLDLEERKFHAQEEREREHDTEDMVLRVVQRVMQERAAAVGVTLEPRTRERP
jgi:hypothetical protein